MNSHLRGNALAPGITDLGNRARLLVFDLVTQGAHQREATPIGHGSMGARGKFIGLVVGIHIETTATVTDHYLDGARRFAGRCGDDHADPAVFEFGQAARAFVHVDFKAAGRGLQVRVELQHTVVESVDEQLGQDGEQGALLRIDAGQFLDLVDD